MKVDLIPKRTLDQAYAEAPDHDWIRLTDFCGRVVYLEPHETEELITQIREAANLWALGRRS